MRDSGKDRIDEIKLVALLDCPFFEIQDFDRIKQFAFMQSDLVKGNSLNSTSRRDSLIGCFAGQNAICSGAEPGSRARRA
jgi:hypothetical protein